MLKKILSMLFITFIIITLSCAERGNGDELTSELAGKVFYSNPEQIIRQFDKNSENYQKNFILANAYRDRKELKNAMLYYANSCFKKKFNFNLRLFPQPVYAFLDSSRGRSVFFRDSAYEIASIFYSYGENEYVIKFTELIEDDNSALYRDSALLRSKSRQKLNQFQEALDELQKLSDSYTDSESQSLIYMRIAAIYESADNFSKAADSYIKVIKSESTSWQNSIAAKRLIYFIREKGIKLDSKEKLLHFASALYDAGEYENSLNIADTILQKEKVPDAEIIKLKILTRRNYPKSIIFLKERIKEPDYEKLLLEHANILWDKGNKYIAVKNYEKLSLSSDKNISDRVLTRLSFYFEERNRPEFIKYMELFIKKFPEDSQSGRFIWLIGRYYIKTGNKGKAAEYFNREIKYYPENSYTSYSRFWLNKIRSSEAGTIPDELLENLAMDNPDTYHAITLLKNRAVKTELAVLTKQYEDAKKNKNSKRMLLFHTLLFMKTGYNNTSMERLKHLDKLLIEPYLELSSLIKNPVYKSSYEKILTRIENYFIVGEIDSVNREIRLIPENDLKAQKDLALALTVYSSKYGFYNYSSFYGFRLLGLMKIKENISLLPRNFAQALYPFAFPQCVNEESKTFQIKKELLLSMMKVESNFNYNAVSPAGATGLMQLMPVTAKGIAKELHITDFNLNDPCTSIKFGANYIAWLSRYYKGQVEYIVSGYNAGAGNVDKWKKRDTNKNIDLFSEFTPFDETRDYIFRTKKYMIQYEIIYKNNK